MSNLTLLILLFSGFGTGTGFSSLIRQDSSTLILSMVLEMEGSLNLSFRISEKSITETVLFFFPVTGIFLKIEGD